MIDSDTRVLVKGHGTGRITGWIQQGGSTYIHRVHLDNGQNLEDISFEDLIPINSVSIETGTARFTTLQALHAEIESTEQTLRNLKSALVLIEGA